jgi:hypothetical protein
MWSVIPVFAILLAQTNQPIVTSKSYEWCFDRGQGAQLCEATEAECNRLRDINTEIAKSPCKRVEPPGIKVSPSEPSVPPSPEKQTPIQR